MCFNETQFWNITFRWERSGEWEWGMGEWRGWWRWQWHRTSDNDEGGTKSTRGIGACLTQDFRDKEKRNTFMKRSHELSLSSSKMSKRLVRFCVQVNIEWSWHVHYFWVWFEHVHWAASGNFILYMYIIPSSVDMAQVTMMTMMTLE